MSDEPLSREEFVALAVSEGMKQEYAEKMWDLKPIADEEVTEARALIAIQNHLFFEKAIKH